MMPITNGSSQHLYKWIANAFNKREKVYVPIRQSARLSFLSVLLWIPDGLLAGLGIGFLQLRSGNMTPNIAMPGFG